MSNDYEEDEDNIHDEETLDEEGIEEESEGDALPEEEVDEEIEEGELEEDGEPESEEGDETDEGDEPIAAEERPRATITKELKRTKREELRAKAQVEHLQAELQRQHAFAQQVWQESQRAIQESEAQRQYAQSLSARVQDTSQAYMEQHEDMLNIRITQAEKMKREAIESGDLDAQLEADRNINAVMYDMGEHQRWKAREEVRKKFEAEEASKQESFSQYQAQQQYMQAQQQQAAYQQEVHETVNWLQTNQWADPRSSDHDPELVQVMDEFADNYENQLRNSGYGHLVGTTAFKQKISEIANQYRNGKQTQKGNLNMRTPRHPVNTSRGAGGRVSEPTRTQASLRPGERDIVDSLRAAGLPISKEKYLASKQRDMKLNPEGRRTGRASISLNLGR